MNRLKELRTDRDLKQTDLAQVIGTTPATISRYESGEITLTPELIGRFCDYYQVTADYLLGRSDYPSPAVSSSDTELLLAYHDAPAEIRVIIDTALDPYKRNAQNVNSAS